MLRREVVRLGRVVLRVVELPAVLVEAAPAGDRRVDADRLPALVPDGARAEHREEGALLRRRDVVAGERRAEAHALERLLRVALHDLGQLHAEQVVHRRDDVGRVQELVPELAPGLDSLRPRDDQRIRDAALEVVALPHLERRVEGPRPADRIVVVGPRRAEVVDVLQVLLDRVGDAVEELVLVDGAVRPALAARAVVGDEDDDRVLELARLLEEVEQPPDLVIGVREEARVHLGHAAEEPLLVVGERVPRADDVDLVPRLSVGARLVHVGVDRRQLRVLRGRSRAASAARTRARDTPRSPCRSGPCTCRSTPWRRDAARASRPGRST